MTRHNVDYKKIRTDIINGKKRCIYMKPKGKREYVKSGGEFVSLSAYIKTLQKKNKKKGGGDGEGDEDVPQTHRYFGPEPSPVSSPVNSPRNNTKEPLPDGWVEKISTINNEIYYEYPDTGAVTRADPRTKADGSKRRLPGLWRMVPNADSQDFGGWFQTQTPRTLADGSKRRLRLEHTT
jgi:hypothetical protein